MMVINLDPDQARTRTTDNMRKGYPNWIESYYSKKKTLSPMYHFPFSTFQWQHLSMLTGLTCTGHSFMNKTGTSLAISDKSMNIVFPKKRGKQAKQNWRVGQARPFLDHFQTNLWTLHYKLELGQYYGCWCPVFLHHQIIHILPLS